jgi:hypothetical protein
MLVGTGIAVVGSGLLDVPRVVPYVGRAIGSVGMGIVFPTISLSAMGEVEEGWEAGELPLMILMDYLGVGIGAGLGGGSVTPGGREDDLDPRGLAGAFGVGIVSALLLALVAPRLPEARAA